MFALFHLDVSEGRLQSGGLAVLSLERRVHYMQERLQVAVIQPAEGWHSSEFSLRWSQNNLKSLKSQNHATEARHRICGWVDLSLSATLETCQSASSVKPPAPRAAEVL